MIKRYRQRRCTEHPKASSAGCVYEHRIVAERALGKLLPLHAEVHHVDGDKAHNQNRNLVICQDRAYHMLLHRRARVLQAGGNPNTHKWCRGCKGLRLIEDFGVSARDGVQAICRPCAREEAKKKFREKKKAA